MDKDSGQELVHSSRQFGKQRDFWWNPDFVKLLAERVGFGAMKYVADIGCGLGHWSAAIIPVCHPEVELTCVDQEDAWVGRVAEEVRSRVRNSKLKIQAIQCDAHSLDLPDRSFDLVTCQTVLMHLHDPIKAIREMLRIAKPTGTILLVEPNNLMNYIQLDSTSWTVEVRAQTAMYAFWMYCNRGRIANGSKNDAIGQILPELMSKAGLRNINICLSDKAYAMVPPYDSNYERSWIEQARRGHVRGSDDELSELASAGGAPQSLIEEALDYLRESDQRVMAMIDQHQYFNSGGSLMYIAWANKAEEVT